MANLSPSAPYIKDPDIRRAIETLWTAVFDMPQVGKGTAASTAALTLPSNATLIDVTGTTNVTSITATRAGHFVVLKFNDVLVMTDGSNLALAGNFTTSANDTMSLICDGTNWLEVSRSTN